MAKDNNIEEYYQEYLGLVGLVESELHESQRIETRRAFFAGFTKCFRELMSGGFHEWDDYSQIGFIDSLEKEFTQFWDKKLELDTNIKTIIYE